MAKKEPENTSVVSENDHKYMGKDSFIIKEGKEGILKIYFCVLGARL